MDRLEKAAEVLLAPPEIVTNEQRREAENVFLEFRQTKNPFNLCREILENSQNHYLLYESATLLKLGIVKEWTTLSNQDTSQLRRYIIQYVVNKTNISHYVKSILLQVVGIMVKRISIDEHNQENELHDRSAFISEVEKLISTPDHRLRMIGCEMIEALMQEYAITRKSADSTLHWREHMLAKKLFENSDLVVIFQYIMNILSEIVNVEAQFTNDICEFLNKLLTIAENTLSWNFSLGIKCIEITFRLCQIEDPSLRVGSQWRNIFLNSGIVKLFFNIFWKIRNHNQLGVLSLYCLVQLASLDGAVYAEKNACIDYLNEYLTCLFSLLTNINITKAECLGFSKIFTKMTCHFLDEFSVLPGEMLRNLLEHVTNLTCKFAQDAAKEETLSKEEQMIMEPYENMLQSWYTIVYEAEIEDIDATIKSKVNSSKRIFDTYLQCHLAQPQGTREAEAVDEIDLEVQQPDSIMFKQQLSVIGYAGRMVLDHSIPILTHLLEDRISQLRGQLSQIIANNLVVPDNCSLDPLYEDLHWIILITGSLLIENPKMPEEIVKLSVKSTPNINLEATLKLLACPAQMPNEIPNFDKTDPVIRLISAVLRLAETESQALSTNLGPLLSPELSSTIMWFFSDFSKYILMPDETIFEEMSMALSSAFGRDSEGSIWMLNYLVSMIERTLKLRSSEPQLVEDTTKLLISLTKNKERRQYLIKSEGIMKLVNLQKSDCLAHISSQAQKGLMQGIVACGAAFNDPESRQQYWQHVLDNNVAAFKALVSSDSFTKQYHDEGIKRQIIYHIDNFDGAIRGCMPTTVHEVFQRVYLIMVDGVKIIDLFHNYPDVVESVLQLFVDSADELILPSDYCHQIYEVSMQLITTYTKHNINKTIDTKGDDNQWKDITLIIEILTSLISKDFFNLEISLGEHVGTVFISLNALMSLMTKDLLEIPITALPFFKLIVGFTECYTEKLGTLPLPMLENLFKVVEFGLESFDTNIRGSSFECLIAIGNHIYRSCPEDSPLKIRTKVFLKIVLDLILSLKVNSSRSAMAGSTLYILICCYPEEYQLLVGQFLETQKNPVVKEKLAKAFTALTKSVKLDGQRMSKMAFRERFDHFWRTLESF